MPLNLEGKADVLMDGPHPSQNEAVVAGTPHLVALEPRVARA